MEITSTTMGDISAYPIDTAPLTVCIHCITYNHEKYIENTLKGFVMQKTDFPFIAVVIDDCSPDKTAEIIRRYEELYPDIIKGVYLQENYYSQGKSKQVFFDPYDSRAKYIAFCEGDDCWTEPLKLSKQVSFLENNPQYGLCFTDYSLADQDMHLLSISCFANGKNRSTCFLDHLLSQGYIAPMTWVFRKSAFLSICIPSGFIDWTFAVALEFFQNSSIGYIDINTAVHVIHPDSACHQTDPQKQFLYKYDVFKEQLYFAEKYAGESVVTRIEFEKYLSLLPDAIIVNNQEFIQRANAFFSSKGAHFDDIYNHALSIVHNREEIIKARCSRSYRLGRAILRPFKRLVGNGSE